MNLSSNWKDGAYVVSTPATAKRVASVCPQLVDSIMVWRDSLAEGPISVTNDAPKIRAQYFLDRYGISFQKIYRSTQARDFALIEAAQTQSIYIVVEPHLTSWLQMLEVVYRLHLKKMSCPFLIRLPAFPWLMSDAQIDADLKRTSILSADVMDEFAELWNAYSIGPKEFLAAALRLDHLGSDISFLFRLLRELPWIEDALSLSERTALKACGERDTVSSAYSVCLQLDKEYLIEDLSFFATVYDLSIRKDSLVVLNDFGCTTFFDHNNQQFVDAFLKCRLSLTKLGIRVLSRKKIENRSLIPRERYWGGYKINKLTPLRWCETTNQIIDV